MPGVLCGGDGVLVGRVHNNLLMFDPPNAIANQHQPYRNSPDLSQKF